MGSPLATATPTTKAMLQVSRSGEGKLGRKAESLNSHHTLLVVLHLPHEPCEVGCVCVTNQGHPVSFHVRMQIQTWVRSRTVFRSLDCLSSSSKKKNDLQNS